VGYSRNKLGGLLLGKVVSRCECAASESWGIWCNGCITGGKKYFSSCKGEGKGCGLCTNYGK
jgi:hypothetical protein